MIIKSICKRIIRQFQEKRIIYVEKVEKPYVIQLVEANRFKGQVAIVTGGSGVIGRAIAYRLASEGAKVYVCGSKLENAKKVADEICREGYLAEPIAINVMSEESVREAFQKVYDENNKIDLLVCCAGGGAREKMKPLNEQKMDVVDGILNINLRGGIMSTKEVSRFMIPQKNGKIIIISSTVGVCGLPSYSEYAAAKAGLMGFVKSIAMEMGKYGVRINCVTPGIVQRGTIDDLKLEQIHKTNWLNSYGKPEDIAGMVAYLNSEEASFITGQNFIVDGGRSLGLKNS